MIRLVWRTDAHLSDQAPASRIDDWPRTVLGKLRQTVLVANKIGADGILDGGDFYHVKSPSRNSHALLARVADLHAECRCPVYACIGNHDCVYGDYSYLDQQPLGVLFSSGVFNRLYDEHEVVFTSCAAVPEDPQRMLKVRVVGIPYHGARYDWDRLDRITRGDEDYLVVVAHVLASEKGGSMFDNEDVIRYEQLLDHPADVFCLGHWHRNQGVKQLGGKTFVNIGSLTRGALTQDAMDRKPAIAVLTFSSQRPLDIKVVNLRVEPAEVVFDVERREQVVERSNTIDQFVGSVKANLVDAEREPVENTVGRMDLPEQVRETALLYWERAKR